MCTLSCFVFLVFITYLVQDIHLPSGIFNSFFVCPGQGEALQSQGRDGVLFSSGLFLVYLPQTSLRAIEFSCGELYGIFGSCHVMDISGSAVCV